MLAYAVENQWRFYCENGGENGDDDDGDDAIDYSDFDSTQGQIYLWWH